MTENQGGGAEVDVLHQQFYVVKAGDAIGPITGEKLVDMIKAGAIDPATTVNKVGEAGWRPLRDYPVFADAIGAAPPPIPGPPGPRPQAAETRRIADFWIRLGAFAVDYLITLAVCLILGQIVIFAEGPENVAALLQTYEHYFRFLGVTIQAAYNVYFVSGKWQATPGKRLCGIYVVQEDGAPMTTRLALARYFSTILSAAIFFVGFLMVLWTKENRALHDMICRTRVVYGKLGA